MMKFFFCIKYTQNYMERAFFINRNLTSSIFDTSTIYAKYCTRALSLKNSIRRPGAKKQNI